MNPLNAMEQGHNSGLQQRSQTKKIRFEVDYKIIKKEPQDNTLNAQIYKKRKLSKPIEKEDDSTKIDQSAFENENEPAKILKKPKLEFPQEESSNSSDSEDESDFVRSEESEYQSQAESEYESEEESEKPRAFRSSPKIIFKRLIKSELKDGKVSPRDYHDAINYLILGLEENQKWAIDTFTKHTFVYEYEDDDVKEECPKRIVAKEVFKRGLRDQKEWSLNQYRTLSKSEHQLENEFATELFVTGLKLEEEWSLNQYRALSESDHTLENEYAAELIVTDLREFFSNNQATSKWAYMEVYHLFANRNTCAMRTSFCVLNKLKSSDEEWAKTVIRALIMHSTSTASELITDWIYSLGPKDS